MRNVTVETARSPLIAPEWQLIAFLWFCYVLNHATGRSCTRFSALQKTFGFSNAVLGLTGALFLWVFGVFSPIAGVLGDRFSKTAIMLGKPHGMECPDRAVGTVAQWNVFAGVQGTAGSFGIVFHACRLRNHRGGAWAAHPFPSHGDLRDEPADWCCGRRFPQCFYRPEFDWRVSFWLLGGIGIMFVLPLSRFFRRMPAEFTRTEIGASANLTSFFVLFKIPTVRIIAFAIAVATFGLFLVYTWLPTFLYDKFHIGLARAGFEASVYPQVGTACGSAGGRMAGRPLHPEVKASRFWVIRHCSLLRSALHVPAGLDEPACRSAARRNRRGVFRRLYHGNQAAGDFRCGSPQIARFCYRRTESGIGVCFGLCAVSGRTCPQHDRRESVDVVYGCNVSFYRTDIALRSLTALQNGQNR